jgi:hypothetical protein
MSDDICRPRAGAPAHDVREPVTHAPRTHRIAAKASHGQGHAMPINDRAVIDCARSKPSTER